MSRALNSLGEGFAWKQLQVAAAGTGLVGLSLLGDVPWAAPLTRNVRCKQRRESKMDHREVGWYWNGNADTWSKLARAGYDVYRDYLNTPAFFDMLPDVAGLSGLLR